MQILPFPCVSDIRRQEGVSDHSQTFTSSPLQIGVFLPHFCSTAPTSNEGLYLYPTYILHQGTLFKFRFRRRGFGMVIKKLISDDLSEQKKSGWTNVLIYIIYNMLILI